MASEKKQSVLNGAMILMFAVVLVKIIGMLFKIPLTDMIGSVGRGYFNSAYEIYTPVFAISMAGLPVAVARMVAENVALECYREARVIFKVAKKLFFVVGIVGTCILAIAAFPYTSLVAGSKSLPAVLVVTPSIFFCCLMSAHRGYYEGLRNMVPTACSQVIEALGKLCIGLAAAKLVIYIGNNQYTANLNGEVSVVFGQQVKNLTEANSVIYPWAAAGAVLGVTVGAFASMSFLFIYHKIKGDGFTRAQLVASPKPTEGSVIAKNMIKIAVPMVVSSLILNITNLIDTVTIQSRLIEALTIDKNAVISMHSGAIEQAVAYARLNVSDIKEIKSYIWGAYGMALDFRNLVPTITIQLGVSALPALAAAWALKDKENIRSTIETVIRIGMLIALPAGIGMAVLSEPILGIIYGRGNSSDAISIVAPIMTAYGLATCFMAISTPTTNMLQAIGRTDIPVKSVLVAAICKIVCNYILVGNPNVNIYGAVVGTIVFYVVIVAINMISLLKISKVHVNWFSVFIKPLICAALCGLTAYAVNSLLVYIFKPDITTSVFNMGTVSLVVSVGLGAIVYLISLLLFKGIAREDVSVLPKGEKIAKTLAKYGLLG